MTRAMLLIAGLTACGAAGSDHVSAGPQPAPAPQAERADCGLSISFGSYAMGIDGGAFRAVETLLDQDPAIASVERRGWGREGEVTLCAEVRSDADAERLLGRIARMLPANPRGPIEVRTRAGLAARAPPR